MKPYAFGGAIAFAVFAADQSSKVAVLSRVGHGANDVAPLTPFLDLAVRWNHGISFSLFSQDTNFGRAVLLILSLVAIALLVWWLLRSRSNLAAAGLGAIIGGALGNAFDRIVHGAVVDFLDLHALGRHFFVFNFADAAINLGVALLLVDVFFVSREQNGRNETGPGLGAS